MTIPKTVSAIVIGLATAQLAYSKTLPVEASQSTATRRAMGVVFANDGKPMQASIDFYRAVYTALAQNPTWEPLPLAVMRKSLFSRGEHSSLGGIPAVDREGFRSKLPKRSNKAGGKVTPGAAVPELQRFLDNTRAPAAIVVDCARKSRDLLRACGLYYYDRVLGRVAASSVKTFVSGANDATQWAGPMLKNLEDGIAAAQHSRDQAVIEELVARNEEDEEGEDAQGLIGLFGRGDRAGVSSGWKQTISGGGLQLGFLRENVGAYAEVGQLNWTGSSNDITAASRLNYGISMIFRASALDSLLWFFELGGGKEVSTFKGQSGDDRLVSEGIYVNLGPGIGLELSDFFSLSFGVGWRWFFESSTSTSGALKDMTADDIHATSLSLRAMILL